MSDESPELPKGVKLPYRYKRNSAGRKWFIDGARDGAANRPFAHNDDEAFVQQHGQAALTAYSEGYNEGQAARHDALSDKFNPQ